MDVSIIIVNYNSLKMVRDAITSVIEQTHDVSYEIIVVDNHTEDISTLQSEFGDSVRTIQLEENVGFGRANNEAIIYAKGRNILFLNPDTILLNNAVKILSEHLDNNKEVGICGGNLYDENKEPAHSYMPVLPSITWELNNLIGGNLIFRILYGNSFNFNRTNKIKQVGYITGADLMIKKSVLDKCGGFDKDFFMYYEETELCHRVRKQGYAIENIPFSQIIHLEGKTFSISIERERLFYTSRKIFFRKTHSKLYTRVCDTLLKLTFKSRLTALRIFKDTDRYKRWSSVYDVIKNLQ